MAKKKKMVRKIKWKSVAKGRTTWELLISKDTTKNPLVDVRRASDKRGHGWVASIYPRRGREQRAIYDTKAKAVKEAKKWMKRRPRG